MHNTTIIDKTQESIVEKFWIAWSNEHDWELHLRRAHICNVPVPLIYLIFPFVSNKPFIFHGLRCTLGVLLLIHVYFIIIEYKWCFDFKCFIFTCICFILTSKHCIMSKVYLQITHMITNGYKCIDYKNVIFLAECFVHYFSKIVLLWNLCIFYIFFFLADKSKETRCLPNVCNS